MIPAIDGALVTLLVLVIGFLAFLLALFGYLAACDRRGRRHLIAHLSRENVRHKHMVMCLQAELSETKAALVRLTRAVDSVARREAPR
jgi:hypothetical protein